ncbi:MAG: ABC transporter ATP-binding protein, partial [Acidimicrobiales bacterium]
AHRHRFRALAAATVAAGLVGFLVAGTGPLYGIGTCALVGGVVGEVKRRGWGPIRMTAVATLAAPAIGFAADAPLVVFVSLRRLTLLQLRNGWRGFAGLADRLPGMHGPVGAASRWVDAALRDWWLSVAGVVAASVLASMFVAWRVLGAVLIRLESVPSVDRLASVPTAGEAPGPVPARLTDVGYRYPGADEDALSMVSLELGAPEMVAVVGDNGSGKSTLARILAGVVPTTGEVLRAGSVALGRPGGTAVIQQRPESQVLGVRVSDDVAWGMPPDHQVDVASLLHVVGLDGMEQRATTTLSGGELQRLALASALARRPRLLVSDESTAMVDHDGRVRLTELLRTLPARHGTTVVHVTHREEEAEAADRIVHLCGGQVVPGQVEHAAALGVDGLLGWVAAGVASSGLTAAIGGGSLHMESVSHIYAEGTPWAQPALAGLTLSVEAGAGVLVVGDNGSGKSTLAWILAGLIRPSEGMCMLDGRPVTEQVGRVGLAFQHARLQVQRRTVGADLRAAAAIGNEDAVAALHLVGLDPGTILHRPVDQLSGGQLRRVALAGLLARRPRVLILDEPLAGLDSPSRRSILGVLAGLRRATGLTLVVISHDLAGIGDLCERTVRLDTGRLVADETVVRV